MRSTLDIKLCTALLSELLLASKLEQCGSGVDMGSPVLESIPSFKVNNLDKVRTKQLSNEAGETPQTPQEVLQPLKWYPPLPERGHLKLL